MTRKFIIIIILTRFLLIYMIRFLLIFVIFVPFSYGTFYCESYLDSFSLYLYLFKFCTHTNIVILHNYVMFSIDCNETPYNDNFN